MPSASYTATDSFARRAQRSEERRTALMIVVFGAILFLGVLRRLTGGVVFSDNHVFYPSVIMLSLAVAYECAVLVVIRRWTRTGRIVPVWRLRANATIEIAVPLALITNLYVWSPAGHVAALSAPAILLLPLIVLMSTLRLRPKFTLIIGLSAAAGHLALVLHAIASGRVAGGEIPSYLPYPALLALFAVAAALVAREVRDYVREAVDESDARQKADRRVEMVEHDLEVAREIQRGLIPSEAPDIQGFEIAGVSEPADLTGGDYYDWQTLPDGRVAVVLADVTGHGVGPAIVMAVCRAYARASTPLIPDLSPLLERLNDLIHGDVHGMRFITLVIALIDPKKGEIDLLSAGHGPSLLYRAKAGGVEQFGGDGLPLGILPGEKYAQSRKIALAPGDAMLLMTDGYFEWRRAADNEQFGIARVAALFQREARSPAATILQRLDTEVRGFVGTARQDDDMTAVVIKRK